MPLALLVTREHDRHAVEVSGGRRAGDGVAAYLFDQRRIYRFGSELADRTVGVEQT
jgi:hypothetical protein